MLVCEKRIHTNLIFPAMFSLHDLELHRLLTKWVRYIPAYFDEFWVEKAKYTLSTYYVFMESLVVDANKL